MFAHTLLLIVVLVGTASAFRAPVSSRCHISKSTLSMTNDKKTGAKIVTGDNLANEY